MIVLFFKSWLLLDQYKITSRGHHIYQLSQSGLQNFVSKGHCVAQYCGKQYLEIRIYFPHFKGKKDSQIKPLRISYFSTIMHYSKKTIYFV